MMRVKNHHMPATILVEIALIVSHEAVRAWVREIATYLGAMSDPCCMREPQLCQKQL